MREHRRFVTATLVCALGCLGALDLSPGSAEESLARRIAYALEKGSVAEVATMIHLPDHLDARERDAERNGLTTMLDHGLRHFGRPQFIRRVAEAGDLYEFGIGGGPAPYWWRKEEVREVDVFLEVHFGRLGPGLLRLTIVGAPTTPRISAIWFALRASPEARAKIVEVIEAYQDALGLPPDHPARQRKF